MKHTPTPAEYNQGESTPLPWEVESGFDEICKDGTRIPTWNIVAPKGWMESNGTFSRCSVMSELESEGDARLIVTAVNSHAQLVEACKHAMTAMQLWGSVHKFFGSNDPDGDPLHVFYPTLDVLRAAIALAEPGKEMKP